MNTMGETKYQEKMTALGLEEHNLFEIAFSKVQAKTMALSEKYGVDSLLDEHSILLRNLKRMTGLMSSVYQLYTTNQDRAAMMVLTRSVIDINAMLYFLFIHVQAPEERKLRINLFYLDGLRTRLGLSKEPLKERDENYISEEEYNAVLVQKQETQAADLQSIANLEKMIQSSPFAPKMHKNILKYAKWRYCSINKDQAYSWKDLYRFAAGDNGMANFQQDYLSQYVHGLALADIQSSTLHETNPVFCLNLCHTILTKVDEVILKTWFPDDYDNQEKVFRLQMADQLWRNLPQETKEEYLKRLKR